jgi:hypothetical protein
VWASLIAPYISFSIVIGRSRTRLPVAWNTALAMAAAAPTTPISPTVSVDGLQFRNFRLVQ